jgi:hypothetical protein
VLAKCPFCSSEISESLSINGGTCPTCFGEIPGEEAPTDPGAVVRARQEKEDAKTVQRSPVPVILSVLVMASLLVGAAWVATRPPAEVPVLDFDQLEFAEYEIVAIEDPDTEPAPAPTRVRPRPGPSALDRLATGDGPDILVTEMGSGGNPVRGVGGTRRGVDVGGDIEPDIRIGGGSFGDGGMQSIDIGPERRQMRGVTLSDPNDIVDMIRATMEQGIPRLERCYTRSYGTNSALRGEWMLTYTLLESGEVSDVRVEGKTMTDAAMEECITTRVRGWNFQPIVNNQPIAKTLRFRPG